MFLDILLSPYVNNIFYVHNLGRFDGAFLIKSLLDSGFKVKPAMKNNKIISLIVSKLVPVDSSKIRNKKSNLRIKKVKIFDSLQLLNGPLSLLSKNLGGTMIKSTFPHKFSNLDNISYIGPTPDISNYDNITQVEYDKLVKPN